MKPEKSHINAWLNYQEIGHNSAKERIKRLNLLKYSGAEKTLLDLGANQAHFGMYLAEHFKEITCLEPVVARPSYLKENMRWVSESFKTFTKFNKEQFDVVFSFAMTLQVRDFDELEEKDIAKAHYNLVKTEGVMIYESQKLEGREDNIQHVSKMVH